MAGRKVFIKDATVRCINDIDLGAGPTRLLLALMMFTDKDGNAHPSDRLLRSLTGASRENHKRYRKALQDKGLIERYKGKYRSYAYKLSNAYLAFYDTDQWKFYNEQKQEWQWSYKAYSIKAIKDLLEMKLNRHELHKLLVLCQGGNSKPTFTKYGLVWRPDRLRKFIDKVQSEYGLFHEIKFHIHDERTKKAMTKAGKRSGAIAQEKSKNVIPQTERNPNLNRTESHSEDDSSDKEMGFRSDKHFKENTQKIIPLPERNPTPSRTESHPLPERNPTPSRTESHTPSRTESPQKEQTKKNNSEEKQETEEQFMSEQGLKSSPTVRSRSTDWDKLADNVNKHFNRTDNKFLSKKKPKSDKELSVDELINKLYDEERNKK